MNRAVLFFSLCCFLWAVPLKTAGAAQFSTEYLLHVCSVDENDNELIPGGKITCQAYIAGVIDYYNLLKSLKISSGIDFCIPSNVDLGGLQKVVLYYLQRHFRQHEGFVASPVVAMALADYFPCRR